ncbi:MAG: hypothetical protein EAS48_00925 [Chryseobacterium sp.]|nr:MAG: hypothetical protein EAS48_00925 [Chryseobacterium sp.]
MKLTLKTISLCLFFLNAFGSAQSITDRSQLNKMPDIVWTDNIRLADFLKRLKIPIKCLGYIYHEGSEQASTITLRFENRAEHNKLKQKNMRPATVNLFFNNDEATKSAFKVFNKRYGYVEGDSVDVALKNLRDLKIVYSIIYGDTYRSDGSL